MSNTSEQPKHHWIPAVHLARFSEDDSEKRPRDRLLWVNERERRAPFERSAKALGYERGLYTMGDELGVDIGDPGVLDNTFNLYERRLTATLDAVGDSQGAIDFEMWMTVLLPFIAGLTVRHPSFVDNSDAQALPQMSRWIEMSRAIAPLMAAEWQLLEASGDTPFITSDRGFCVTHHTSTGRAGMIVPIAPNLALVIFAQSRRLLAFRQSSDRRGWLTPLPRDQRDAIFVSEVNSHVSATASRWVASGRRESVVDLEIGPGITGPVLGYGWPYRGPLGAHDRAWDAALDMAEIDRKPGTWAPLGIYSSMNPGVSRRDLDGGSVLTFDLDLPVD
ncbi:MAG: DUF4238 domain-containing protein [Rhodococcus sp. (in: high G+C Gram-positive bacteria)]